MLLKLSCTRETPGTLKFRPDPEQPGSGPVSLSWQPNTEESFISAIRQTGVQDANMIPGC